MQFKNRAALPAEKFIEDKPGRRLGAASMLLGALFACSIYSVAGERGDESARYSIGYVDDSTGSALILDGEFSAAQQRLEAGVLMNDRYEGYTNLCVALISQQKYDEAGKPCRGALRYSRVDFGGMQSRARERKALKNRKALALNNLGVLQALQGQHDLARETFKKAADRPCPNSDIAQFNLSVMTQRDARNGLASVSLVGRGY